MRRWSSAALMLAAAVIAAGNGKDASELIRQVSDRAKAQAAWKIRGVIERSASGEPVDEGAFVVEVRGPGRSWFEWESQRYPMDVVCDGERAWTYSPVVNHYRARPAADDRQCAPVVGEWRSLADELKSPTEAGTCGLTPKVSGKTFLLVRGTVESELPKGDTVKRTLCIDASRKTVAWERWEADGERWTQTYTSAIESGEDARRFRFEPPARSRETSVDLPILGLPGRRIRYPLVDAPPKVVQKVAPDSPRRLQKREGQARLWVTIGPDGVPAEIVVFQTISPEYDAEAVKAVRQWRFAPAMKDGQPLAAGVIIEVNFRRGYTPH